MDARTKTYTVLSQLEQRAIALDFNAARSLRRIALTLHRWFEQECGDGNEYASWAIERDEQTGKPYRCVYPHTGTMRRYPIPDREKGAIRRLTRLAKQYGFYFYIQPDPRGYPLYISSTEIDKKNYTSGLAI